MTLEEFPPNPYVFTALVCPACFLFLAWQKALGWDRATALRHYFDKTRDRNLDWMDLLTEEENERCKDSLNGSA